MGKVKSLMLDEEYGQKLLREYQNEVDSYNDLSPEQIQAELDSDPAYVEFISEIESAPF